MSARLPPARTFVTGGAGFIGGEVVASLLADGGEVTVFDDLTTADPDWSAPFNDQPRLTFVHGDAADPTALAAAMPGHGRVVHLASGTDIAGGFGHPERDFVAGVVATEAVCDAMRQLNIRELWYASSGVVYGRPQRIPTAEGDGPLLPESHYAAAKLAGEAIVSGFAHLYGWRAFAFRFGNTVGSRSDHGVVHDFVVKLLRDPRRLEILGDGTQAKPYVAVRDLVAGIRHAAAAAPARPITVLNVGPEGTLPVRHVAEIVTEALDLPLASVEFAFTGRSTVGGGGWPGDTAYVEFDTTALRSLGWRPSMTAEGAVRAAALGIAARYRTSRRPLLTAAERHAPSLVTIGSTPG
jgi:UDP-glucose 4-epimerase